MTRSTELVPKKEGNSNVVATWPRHVISLVITSNDIPLSSLIALTILFLTAYFFDILNHIHLLLEIVLPTSHCWEAYQPSSHLLGSAPASIIFVEKCIIHYHTLLGLIFPPPPLPPYDYWAVGSKMAISQSRAFFGSYPQFRIRKVWWPIARLARRSKYGTMGCQHLHSVIRMDFVRWLIRSLQKKFEAAR